MDVHSTLAFLSLSLLLELLSSTCGLDSFAYSNSIIRYARSFVVQRHNLTIAALPNRQRSYVTLRLLHRMPRFASNARVPRDTGESAGREGGCEAHQPRYRPRHRSLSAHAYCFDEARPFLGFETTALGTVRAAAGTSAIRSSPLSRRTASKLNGGREPIAHSGRLPKTSCSALVAW
ncbi:hypothetical protein FKP32DRAFT_541757 [Trametes sanguinea]|nr:hypothetical protein FKP32DRAFT_541757 [Trametes sanguinea]